MFLGQLLHLEPRRSHFHAQRLHFGRSGYRAAIVVGKHHHRHMFKLWLENAFARDIKVVNVHQRKHGCASHKLTFGGVAAHNSNDNSPHLKLGAVLELDWLVSWILGAQFNTSHMFEQTLDGVFAV